MLLIKHLLYNLFNESFASNTPYNKKLELSDDSLIAKITSSNDPLYFSVLYDRYVDKVYNKCLGFVKNDSEAKDLTQDVFIKLYTKLNTFKGKSKFSSWLYSFTYNFCINYISRNKEYKLYSQSNSINDIEYELTDTQDIEDNYFLKLKTEKLKKSLEKIPLEDKYLLLLKYQDDVSIKELQVLYNANESAIKMKLTRAKLKVVKYYQSL